MSGLATTLLSHSAAAGRCKRPSSVRSIDIVVGLSLAGAPSRHDEKHGPRRTRAQVLRSSVGKWGSSQDRHGEPVFRLPCVTTSVNARRVRIFDADERQASQSVCLFLGLAGQVAVQVRFENLVAPWERPLIRAGKRISRVDVVPTIQKSTQCCWVPGSSVLMVCMASLSVALAAVPPSKMVLLLPLSTKIPAVHDGSDRSCWLKAASHAPGVLHTSHDRRGVRGGIVIFRSSMSRSASRPSGYFDHPMASVFRIQTTETVQTFE